MPAALSVEVVTASTVLWLLQSAIKLAPAITAAAPAIVPLLRESMAQALAEAARSPAGPDAEARAPGAAALVLSSYRTTVPSMMPVVAA